VALYKFTFDSYITAHFLIFHILKIIQQLFLSLLLLSEEARCLVQFKIAHLVLALPAMLCFVLQ